MASPSNSTTTPEVEINALRQYPATASTAANNLHYHQPPPHTPVIHAECLKNHAIAFGGHALDGCGDFMPLSATASLICAACGCHRSFHRRREAADHHRTTAFAPPHYITLRHPAGRSSSSSSPPLPPPPPPPHHFYAVAPALTPGAGKSTKRFRTKFTKLQKEKMHNFAESMGWKMEKCNNVAVENFCCEIGVAKSVLKVWMHNHKKKDGGRKVSGGGNVAENVSTAETSSPSA